MAEPPKSGPLPGLPPACLGVLALQNDGVCNLCTRGQVGLNWISRVENSYAKVRRFCRLGVRCQTSLSSENHLYSWDRDASSQMHKFVCCYSSYKATARDRLLLSVLAEWRTPRVSMKIGAVSVSGFTYSPTTVSPPDKLIQGKW